jgi:hypothetical protein
MDDLTYTLRALCQRNRDGSYATQADRIIDDPPLKSEQAVASG